MSTAEELVEEIDEHGSVVRVVTRAEMRAQNLRHRTVAVVVVTGAGEVVAHRRADWKDVWPGQWDVCFGGVTRVGEDWVEAARRELAEEAGIEVDAPALRELGDGSYADADVSEYSRVFVTTHDGPFHPGAGTTPRTERSKHSRTAFPTPRVCGGTCHGGRRSTPHVGCVHVGACSPADVARAGKTPACRSRKPQRRPRCARRRHTMASDEEDMWE